MAQQTPTKQEIYDWTPMPAAVSNIVYEYIDNPFIITLDMRDPKSLTITIKLLSSTSNFYIDWGDETVYHGSSRQKDILHTYTKPNKYIVHIFGDINKIGFDGVNELIDISQWGNLQLDVGVLAFYNCKMLI